MDTHSLSNQSPWPSLPLVVVSLFLLPLLFLFFRSSKSGKSGTQGARNAPCPPGPPKQLPVLGNLLQLGSRPHRYFQAIARRYGPVVQVQLGRVPTVVVASPEAAKEVLRTNDLQCCSRPNSPGPRMLSYNFLDVAFGPYSDYWREMRKLFVVELLSMRRVQSFAYARAAEVDRLLDSLEASLPGTLVDLSEMLYALSDGIIGTVAFGKMYGSAQSFEKSSFQQVLDETLRVLGSFTFEDFFPSSALARCADVLTGVAWRRRRIFRKIDRFFDLVIDKHLEPSRLQAGVQEDMVDALVKMWREQHGAFRLTRDHVKALLMDTFAGGIDTTAVTTIWMMSELMRNPRVRGGPTGYAGWATAYPGAQPSSRSLRLARSCALPPTAALPSAAPPGAAPPDALTLGRAAPWPRLPAPLSPTRQCSAHRTATGHTTSGHAARHHTAAAPEDTAPPLSAAKGAQGDGERRQNNEMGGEGGGGGKGQKRKKKEVFIYGNYKNYYGYRIDRNVGEDPRLEIVLCGENINVVWRT